MRAFSKYMIWSKKEEKLLKKAHKKLIAGDIDFSDLLKIFPDRTQEAIKNKLWRLNLWISPYGRINTNYLKELKKRGIVL